MAKTAALFAEVGPRRYTVAVWTGRGTAKILVRVLRDDLLAREDEVGIDRTGNCEQRQEGNKCQNLHSLISRLRLRLKVALAGAIPRQFMETSGRAVAIFTRITK
jgi:hypothetical protein